jgi:hypothetical protein
MKVVKTAALYLVLLWVLKPTPAFADFWGGDIPLLTEIVANTLTQIARLQDIIGQGEKSFSYIQHINSGLRDALNLARTMNQKLSPGILSELDGAERTLRVIEQLYGVVPKTSEARVQQTMDRTAAEAISMHNDAFRYADQVDPEAERIKEYAKVASPQAAEKLTAQSVGVLIHVLNQVLRTNAAMLKLQSEQLALQNRREKLGSEQFKVQYESLAKAFGSLRPEYKLPRLTPN